MRKISVVTARLIFVCSLLLLSAAVAFAQGEYQRTKDGKTFVWNADPKPGEATSWFGDRDKEGYATGAGTVTWYTANGEVYGRFFGNMVRGKFNGPVNLHANGRTVHAIYGDGKRITRWSAGPAPSRWDRRLLAKANKSPPTPSEATAAPLGSTAGPQVGPLPIAKRASPEGDEIVVRPQPPAEGPPAAASDVQPTPSPQRPTPEPSITVVRAETPAEEPSPAGLTSAQVRPNAGPEKVEATKPTIAQNSEPTDATKSEKIRERSSSKKSSVDNSLAALVGPPSSLRNIPPNSELTQQEATYLADAEARSEGYDLNEFQRPKADYSTTTGKWTFFYDQKPVDGLPQIGKYIIATVEDKTRKAVVTKKRDESEQN